MRHVSKDLTLVALSILLAVVVGKLDLVENLLSISQDIRIAGSFVGGFFFTSFFTTATAIVLLGEIGQIEPIFLVALIGTIGAVFGDLLIFFLFKNHFIHDFDGIMHHYKRNPLKFISKNKSFRWLSTIIGALIIASPLPDELGVAMMGLSKLSWRIFVPISLAFNFLGILLIGSASQLII